MKDRTDILCRVLLLVSATILICYYFNDTACAFAFTVSATFSCLLWKYDALKINLFICLSFTTAAFFFAPLCAFLPLILFDTRNKLFYVCAAAYIACAIMHTAVFKAHGVCIILTGILFSALLNRYSEQNTKLRGSAKASRDEAVQNSIELKRENLALKTAKEYENKIAVLEERSRIAREVHDGTGHLLSRALLQTGALLAKTKNEKEKESLISLSDTLKQAMESIRKSVHKMQQNVTDINAEILKCAKQFYMFECEVNCNFSKNADPEVLSCFDAAIKEAFTNAQKHSNASKIKIFAQEHPAFYSLNFCDNGSSVSNAQSCGIGLKNIRERAQALGGTASFSINNGFSIHIHIPKGASS